MHMSYFKARGAIGFKKGLGVDEVEIDLSENEGLVAIAGPNGIGKTTFMELMTPYRTFASRKGAMRHHFFLRDSYVLTRFVYNDDQWEVLRKIDSGSDRAEAFIKINGRSMVDGKLKDYDRFIIEHFGSQALFYNSVFCAQGADTISDMTPANIKKLFVEFLRLDRFAAYEDTARAMARKSTDKIGVLEGKKDALSSLLVDLDSLKHDMRNHEFMVSTGQGMVEEKKAILKEKTKEIEHLATVEANLATERRDVERLRKESNAIKADVSDLEAKALAESSAINRLEEKKRGEISRLSSVLKDSDAIKAAAAEADRLEALDMALTSFIECLMTEHGDLDIKARRIDRKEIEPIRAELEELKSYKGIPEMMEKLEAEKRRRAETIDRAVGLKKRVSEIWDDFELMTIKTQVETCQSTIEASVDPDCTNMDCPAQRSIRNAKDNLPILQARMADRKKDIETQKDELESAINIAGAEIIVMDDDIFSLEKEIERRQAYVREQILTLSNDLNDAKKRREEILAEWMEVSHSKTEYLELRGNVRQGFDKVKTLADRAFEVVTAESKIEKIEGELKIALDASNKRLSDLAWERRAKERRLSSMMSELADRNAAEEKMEKEVEGLERARDDADMLRVEIDTLEKNIAESEREVAVLGSKIDDAEKRRAESEQIEGEIKAETKESVEWQYLREACGKNGVQALEIDGAAPLITREANGLLERSFGLDYQIRIITQDEETGRETFEIVVIRDDGTETHFSNLSGGQQVWVAKALSLGMTMVSKYKSGRDFRTIFSDEETGPLDPERAVSFVQLYRAMIEAGGFDACYIISHNPEVAAMADAVVDLSTLSN